MEKVYLARLRKLSGAAHLIHSSALPDKLFHPRHQPNIPYLSGRVRPVVARSIADRDYPGSNSTLG